MESVNLAELKANLSSYARRVKEGETVIVCERNKPIAEIRPIPKDSVKKRRPAPGRFRDSIKITEDFFASDSEIESDWLGKS